MSNQKPLLVDLCCGAGGCSMGYANAGFDVQGIDINEQPSYPFKFTRANVLDLELPKADLYHASPPCQLFSIGTKKDRNKGKAYPDVLTPLRKRLIETGKPFVIENVIGAPVRKDIVLCGEMFGLRVVRHRIFEIHGFTVLQPPHIKHKQSVESGELIGVYGTKGALGFERQRKKILAHKKSHYATVAGNGGDSYSYSLEAWRAAMGINWMDKRELTQAIPPAYTEYIGRQALLNFLVA